MSFRSSNSFQTLYEASPIINVTHRSFAVFHPIMYVTHRSFAAPAPLRFEIFSGYTIHILYYAGVSVMPPRVLASGPLGLWASGPKPCGGNYAGVSIMPPRVLASGPKPCGGNNKEIMLGMPNCVGRRVICQSCITNESLNNICIRVFNVCRAVTKGRGPGIFPGYYKSEPRLL